MSSAPGRLEREDRVKVRFALPRDEDGWPPAETEGLWAVALPERHLVRLDNVPWFARNVACGDVFRTSVDENGVRWAVEMVSWSGHCTIRVIPFRNGPLAGDLQRVLDAFSPLGIDGEGIAQYGMVAFDVPPDVDLVEAKRILKDGEANGWWSYEEGCIGDQWAAAG